ncbi:MAG TPA: xanthine dehydrogenase family protein molybdopterin-binding subunit [Stellaceae bacterium]|jgi:carbon-monoxide dehydrogenase large subunit|nr:xanthine dehydrogenase family protein molybdopterin-binding subunit [Stellaceae bacterium]
MGEFAIGQPISRFEDPRLLRGGGRYIDDFSLPGMLHGFVLRSPHAHARILGIDVGAAKTAPGVVAVLTGRDWLDSGFGDLPAAEGKKKRDGSPMYRPHFPALVSERVRYVGDPVAFVIAETLHQAQDAAELIAVEYEALPSVTSLAEAAEPGASLVWEDCPDNICFVHLEGDKAKTDQAFAKADHVARMRFVISRVTAASMETRGAIGHYDAAADRYTVHTPLQRALNYREQLAETLRIPESRLRIVTGDVGGSFGMKSGVFNEAGLVVLGSKVTGRPVKWISSRSESFVADAHGRDNVSDAELALDKNGKFLGLRVRNLVNVGSYTQPGSESGAFGNLGTLAGVYTTPAIHVDVTAIHTNTNPMRPFRGNGRPEAAFVIERIIDIAADELGMDPAELRRINMIPPDAMPFQTALAFKYDSGEFEKCLDAALEMADYKGFEARRIEARRRGKLRGIGMSYTIERAGAPGHEGADIRFDRTGSLTLITGAVTQGQGHETVFKQIVSDQLGIHPDEIQYLQGDTDLVFFGEGTGGSRTSALGGSAVKMVADKVVVKAKAIAAHMLAVDDVDYADGVFTSRSTNRSFTMKEIARASLIPANVPDGMEVGLNANAAYTAKQQNYPNGCHIVELEIDEETGTVEIDRYVVVDDVGTVLNPLLLKGQIIGGIAQGVGQMLMEEIRFDPDNGQILTGSFMDYPMPHAALFPHIDIKSYPVPTRTNPLGVKGAGEAGCVGALPAVGNALVDALAHLGVRHVEMPATPERLWRLIHGQAAAE